MRLIKFLLGSLAVLTVLVVALTTALLFMDLGMFRGQLESAASKAFDRRVTFAGSMRLKPSFRPLIVVEDVRIGNPSWASRPDFAYIQRLEVRVAMAPLLRGQLDTLAVDFHGADVLLEVGPGDSNNFTFGHRIGPPELPDIHRFNLRESVMGYRDAGGELHSCTVQKAEARNMPGQPISLAGELACQDVPLQFSLSAGAPEAFASRTAPWPMTLTVSTGDASLVAEGNLPRSRTWDKAAFRVSVQGEQVDSVQTLFDVALPLRGPFEVSAHLRRSEEAYSVSALKASIGSTDITGELEWKRATDRPVLKGKLASQSLQLKDFFPPPDPGSADKTKPDAMDRPVPLDWLAAIDAELVLAVGVVVDSPVPIRNATATAKLSGGELTLSPWRATLAETPVTGDLTISQTQDAAEIGLAARIERLDLGHLLQQLHAGGPIQGGVDDLSLGVSSRGRTMRALLKRADLNLKTQKGRITSADDKSEEPWAVEIAAAEIEAKEAQPVRLRVDGEFRAVPVALVAETTTIEALTSGVESWPFSIEARAADAVLTADGAIVRKVDGPAVQLHATLEGNRVAALTPLLGVSLPDARPYRLSAALRKSEDVFTVSDLKGKVGSTDITGELEWSQAEDRPLLRGKLASNSMRVQDLLATPASRSSGKKEPGVLDRAVPLDWLAAIDAELELDVRRVLGSPVPIRNAAATAKLDKSGLTLSPLRAILAGTAVTGDLTIALEEAGARIGLAARARRLDVGDTLAQLKAGAQIQGSVEDLRLAVSSHGGTIRALLQRADLNLKTQTGRISSADNKGGTPWTLDLATAEIEAKKAQPLRISVDGKHRNAPFALTANLVTLEGLATGTRPWPLGVSLQAHQASLSATGRVAQPFQGKGFDLAVEITGKDLRKLDPLIDYVIPLRGAYRVTGRFSDHENGYDLSDIQVHVGQSDMGGSIAFVKGKTRPRISASLRSQMVHYDDLEFVEGTREPEDSAHIIPDYTLPIEALLAVNLDVDIEADRIRMGGGDLGDLVLKVAIENGRSVSSVRVRNPRFSGHLSAEHKVDATTDPPVNSFQLTARDLDYGLILTDAKLAELAEGKIDVDIELAGPGATQRGFLAQADGRISVIGGPGRIASREYGLWSSDLVMTMLTARWRRESITEINCIAGHIDVKDGVVKTDKLLLDTTQLTIAGSGTLDLGTEKLDFVLSPRPKQARLVSVANPVRVTGTLAAPKVAVTALPRRRTAIRGLVAGLVNPALLVFAFTDTGSGRGNRCVAATEKLDSAANE